jgi:hypothetical protein
MMIRADDASTSAGSPLQTPILMVMVHGGGGFHLFSFFGGVRKNIWVSLTHRDDRWCHVVF